MSRRDKHFTQHVDIAWIILIHFIDEAVLLLLALESCLRREVRNFFQTYS